MLLDALARGFGLRGTWHVAGGHPRDPVLADLLGLGANAKSGLVVNEKTALTHSGVWRAVNFRSMVMADIPVSIYRRTPEGGKIRLLNHPIYPLLHDIANEDLFLSAFTRQQLVESQVLLWGNSFAWIERRGGTVPVAIWPHPPNMVSVDITREGRIVYTFHGVRESDKDYAPRDVLHFKGMSPDGIIGWSRIRQARESIGQSLAAQQFGGAYFGQGARMGMVVTTLPGFRPEDAKLMKESIAAQSSGPENWHRPLVIPQADKVIPMTYPPEDSQFLGTQSWGIAESGRWFDVPLVFMILPNSEPRANAEQDTLNFVTTTIAPACRNFEQELNLKLLLPGERGDLFIEHNVDALLRGDFKSRMEGYHLGLTDGLYSRNDCLRRENMDPIAAEDGGDIRTVAVNSMNLKAIVGQTAPPGNEPKPQSSEPPEETPEPMPEEDDSERGTDWVATYEPLFADACERLLSKEKKAFDAAIGKNGAAAIRPDARRAFYDGHRDAVRYVLLPLLVSVAGEREAALMMVDDVADRYCIRACREPWPNWRDERAWEFLRNECRIAVKDFKGYENGKADGKNRTTVLSRSAIAGDS